MIVNRVEVYRKNVCIVLVVVFVWIEWIEFIFPREGKGESNNG